MSENQIADFVTGHLLPPGSDAVALVIGGRSIGPRLRKGKASVGVSPSHLFEALSLPIFGVTGEYTEFLPAPGDVGASLLLSRSEFDTWERFAGRAFGLNGGIKIDTERGEEGLGLAVMARRTFELACDRYSDRTKWMSDIDEAVEVVLHARSRYLGEDGMPGDFGAMRLMGGNNFVFSDGRRVDNRLMGILSDAEGDGPVCRALRRALHDGRGILDYGSDVDAETLRSLVELLQAHLAVSHYLEARNRYLVPSPSANPDRGHTVAVGMAIDDVELALGHAIEKLDSELVPSRIDMLHDRIERLKMLTAAAEQRCAAMEAELDTGPTP